MSSLAWFWRRCSFRRVWRTPSWTGLPAVTGIYTTIAALVAYAVFGPNRKACLGPRTRPWAPVIAAVVVPLAAGDDGAAVAIASAMSLLAGVICVLSGVFRLGVVTELLSKPIRVGYLNGIAVLILVSQIPKALGFSTDSESPFGLIGEIFTDIANGDIKRQCAAHLRTRYRPDPVPQSDLPTATGCDRGCCGFDLGRRTGRSER